MKTNCELTIRVAETVLKVPMGAEVIYVKGMGGGYALKNPRQFGLNNHDATHRYAWVPGHAVDHDENPNR